jgi:PAS domain S-box-containing protein
MRFLVPHLWIILNWKRVAILWPDDTRKDVKFPVLRGLAQPGQFPSTATLIPRNCIKTHRGANRYYLATEEGRDAVDQESPSPRVYSGWTRRVLLQEHIQELWNNLAGVKTPPSMLKNQLLAVTFVSLAMLLGFALQPLVPSFPALLPLPFLLAVACAAFYGDLGSAITATILSAASFRYFLFASPHGSSVSGLLLLRTGLFVLLAGFLCVLVLKFREVKTRGLRSQSIHSDFILQKAHEQMRMLVTSISESFIALDREWRFQYANQRVLEQTGKSWTELKGRNMWEIFPEAARSAFRPGYEKVMQERIPHTFDVTYPQPDGAVRYYQVHAYPTSEGLAALVSDITQAKEAQDALFENKRLLRLVLDSADVGTWMWNFETNEVLDLGNTAKLFGREDIASFEDFYAVIHPEDRPVVLSSITSAKNTGQYQCEFRVIKNGITRWLRGTGTVFRNDEGNPLYLAGVTIDVTEKNRSEEERFRLAAIVESSDDAIISKDLNGIVASWNNAAEHLFGYRSDEMIGESILKIIPDELHDEEPRILASLRAGQKIDHYETERLRKDGTRVSVALTISPVKDLSGKIIGASKIARDISERKRVQEALVQSEKLAATGRMAAAIAHEINNPLEAVTNLAYLVSTDPTLSAVARSYTKMLLEEIARASEITKQTLAFYRDSGKPSDFDIRELLDNVIRLNRPNFEKKQIKVVTEYRNSERLVGYASEIRQVMANLLLNAIDAVSQGGTIVVRVDVENSISNRAGCVRVTVADNGHGIRPETKKRLFEPFVTTKGAHGNGLGLWVSKGIVKKHGGSIVMRSSTVPGRSGTVFSVLLPLTQTASARSIA